MFVEFKLYGAVVCLFDLGSLVNKDIDVVGIVYTLLSCYVPQLHRLSCSLERSNFFFLQTTLFDYWSVVCSLNSKYGKEDFLLFFFGETL